MNYVKFLSLSALLLAGSVVVAGGQDQAAAPKPDAAAAKEAPGFFSVDGVKANAKAAWDKITGQSKWVYIGVGAATAAAGYLAYQNSPTFKAKVDQAKKAHLDRYVKNLKDKDQTTLLVTGAVVLGGLGLVGWHQGWYDKAKAWWNKKADAAPVAPVAPAANPA